MNSVSYGLNPTPSTLVPIATMESLLGSSAAMQEVFRLIERVGPTEASVLLTGESGSGKELAAQMIHECSSRRGKPFIAINCGAIPAGLIEAELFGYEKGSFTGAVRAHAGVFERARGGTLLLDEVTEMPLEMQTRLLRVLESRKFYRVGASTEYSCDVRVIAATNRCPLTAVQAGQLREDLLYRLAVFPIDMPPLRNRGDDVELLANHFLAELNTQRSPGRVTELIGIPGIWSSSVTPPLPSWASRSVKSRSSKPRIERSNSSWFNAASCSRSFASSQEALSPIWLSAIASARR